MRRLRRKNRQKESQAFYESLGLTYRPFAIQVEREELYADEGAEGAPEYVPLEAYGSEIV